MKKQLFLVCAVAIIISGSVSAEANYRTMNNPDEINAVDPSALSREELEEAYEGLRFNYSTLYNLYKELLVNSHREEETETEQETTISKEEADELLAGMLEKTDDFDGDIIYYSQHMYEKVLGSIKLKDPFSRFTIQLFYDNEKQAYRIASTMYYSGYDWIFFDALKFKVDDQIDTIDLSHIMCDRDARGGLVYETYSIFAGKDLIDVLRRVNETSEVTVRYSGKDGSATYTLDQNTIDAIIETVEVYDALSAL